MIRSYKHFKYGENPPPRARFNRFMGDWWTRLMSKHTRNFPGLPTYVVGEYVFRYFILITIASITKWGNDD